MNPYVWQKDDSWCGGRAPLLILFPTSTLCSKPLSVHSLVDKLLITAAVLTLEFIKSSDLTGRAGGRMKLLGPACLVSLWTEKGHPFNLKTIKFKIE